MTRSAHIEASRLSRFRDPVFICLCALAIALIIALMWAWMPKTAGRTGLHAVFVDNGQVYFGQIASETPDMILLEQIYYIQRDQNATSTSDVALTKLGTEVHGPEDRMEINREHVLFIEKLRENGRVAEAVRAYEER